MALLYSAVKTASNQAELNCRGGMFAAGQTSAPCSARTPPGRQIPGTESCRVALRPGCPVPPAPACPLSCSHSAPLRSTQQSVRQVGTRGVWQTKGAAAGSKEVVQSGVQRSSRQRRHCCQQSSAASLQAGKCGTISHSLPPQQLSPAYPSQPARWPTPSPGWRLTRHATQPTAAAGSAAAAAGPSR